MEKSASERFYELDGAIDVFEKIIQTANTGIVNSMAAMPKWQEIADEYAKTNGVLAKVAAVKVMRLKTPTLDLKSAVDALEKYCNEQYLLKNKQ